MAQMTMVGNWTGPHPSSINQPPVSSGVRPAGAHSDPASAAQAPRSSRPPPPPATGRRCVSTVATPVDIQICLALSGRPASLDGLSPEPGDAAYESETSPVAASGELSWSHPASVLPLARLRAVPPPRASAPAEPAAASGAPAVRATPPSVVRVSAARPAPSSTAGALPVAAPPQRRRGWLPVVLAALASAVVAGVLLLRVSAPIEAPGAVHEPLVVSTVAATQPGLLVQLLAQPGEPVVAGQIVAQLATAPFEAELQLRWQAFLELQAELGADETALLRDASAATLAHAAQRLVQAQSALGAASVRAPCSGRVEALASGPGSWVTPGQALLHLAPAGVARSLIAYVPAEARPFVSPGARAEVLLQPAGPGAPRTAEARVTSVAPDSAPLAELRALLPEARAESFVRVQLELRDATPELLAGLRRGEHVTVRLPGGEQPLPSALWASVAALLEP